MPHRQQQDTLDVAGLLDASVPPQSRTGDPYDDAGSAATPGSAGNAAGHASHRDGRAPRGRWSRALPGLLAVALVLSLLGGGYLWYVADQWQHRGEQVQAQAAQLEVALADARTREKTLQQEADDATTQLGEATDRVKSLSGEKAQVADQREANAQEAKRSSTQAQQAADVASAMGTCASSLRQLLDLVLSSPDYDYSQAQTMANSADGDCAKAQDAQKSFLATLSS